MYPSRSVNRCLQRKQRKCAPPLLLDTNQVLLALEAALVIPATATQVREASVLPPTTAQTNLEVLDLAAQQVLFLPQTSTLLFPYSINCRNCFIQNKSEI